jgi:hypothetical protein
VSFVPFVPFVPFVVNTDMIPRSAAIAPLTNDFNANVPADDRLR